MLSPVTVHDKGGATVEGVSVREKSSVRASLFGDISQADKT